MAGKAGPYMNNDGLMFHYDTGNTVRSFKGEPTVNLVTPSGIDMTLLSTYTYLGRSQVSELSSPSSFACEMIVEDSTINLASRILFGGAENIPTSGNTFISVSVKFQGGPTSNITPRVFAGVGWTTLNPLDGGSQFITAEYRRFGALIQMGTSSGGPNPGFSMTQSNSNIQVGQKTRWHSPQVELKPHASPFVNGTRSSTQGLLDLTRNSTIDLANVSFDSNAQMTFDGTDDFITPLSPSDFRMGTNSFTLETVVKQDITTAHIILEARGNNLIGYLWTVNYGGAGRMSLFYNDGISSQKVHYQTGDFNITSTQKYYHLVVKVDKGDNKIYFYIDGEQAGNGVALQHTNSISPTSQDFYRIGFDRGGVPWNGEIAVFKHYNRALPAPEILQNFNAIKGRYGL